MSESPTLFSSDDEGGGSEPEEFLLKKFQIMMQGVPPPPSVTMSKLSAVEMLTKYNENKEILGYNDMSAKRLCKTKNKTPLVYYFNSSDTSEEIAILSQKVLSRFVYSETMSTCNIWFEDSTKLSSAKKFVCKNSTIFSPGRRLSHLARRRQIFSSENLQKLANTDKRNQIDIGKQKVSKCMSFLKNKSSCEEKNSSFKRALFLSPDDSNDEKQPKMLIFSQNNSVHNSTYSIPINNDRSSRSSQDSSKRSYSEKGRRMVSKEKSRNWPRRALTFTEKDMGKNPDVNSSNLKVISEIQLNLRHKTKILWAVSVTLKEKNINTNNALFKSSASALFMICRKNLNKILDMKIEGGTSDKILHFAREHVDDILNRLHKSKENNPMNLGSNNVNNSLNINSNRSVESCEPLRNNDVNSTEHSEHIGNINCDNDKAAVSTENENDIGSNAGCKVSNYTISTVVGINARNCEKENFNLGESNCNLLSAV